MVGAWAAAWGRVAAGRALPDVVNAEAPEARRAAAVYFLRCYRRVRGPVGRLFRGAGCVGARAGPRIFAGGGRPRLAYSWRFLQNAIAGAARRPARGHQRRRGRLQC